MAGRKAQMSGIFDWFRKLVPPAPGSMIPFVPVQEKKSQLPILRPGTLPAAPRKESKQLSIFDFAGPIAEQVERGLILPPPPPPVSIFDLMAPAPEVPEPAQEEGRELAVWSQIFKPSERPTAPSVDMFELMAQTPEAPTQDEMELEKEVWGRTFTPPKEPMAPPDMYEFMKPAAQAEARRFMHPDEWPFGEPPIWMNSPWKMPTTFELAEYIRNRWDLHGMYEYTLSQVESPYWRQHVEESAHTGKPAEIDVEMISKGKNSTFEVANFLRIPDFVIESYGAYGPEGITRFTVEVLQPMFDRVGKAIDVFRPTRALRGWFELEPDDDMNFWIRYKEAKQYPQDE